MGFDRKNCMYCMKDERLWNAMTEVCALDGATLYLFRNQTHRGRCVIAWDTHVEELYELGPDDRRRFAEQVARVARALREAFQADKINYGIFGDTVPHLHAHLVPKYRHGPDWSQPFAMNPQPAKLLTDTGYQAACDLIRRSL